MNKQLKELDINQSNTFKYYIYTPENVTKNMPVLLFLHGIGERGNNISDIEKYALPKYLNKGMTLSFIIIAPQCLDNNFWSYHLRDIEKILDIEYKNYKYDKNRVCILGSSMGAFGAWNYIIQRPNLFKGIVSVAGGIMLPINQNLKLIKDKKILIYHGDKDDLINMNESISAYKLLEKVGAKNIELKITPEENHYLTSHAFKDKYILEWLERNI